MLSNDSKFGPGNPVSNAGRTLAELAYITIN